MDLLAKMYRSGVPLIAVQTGDSIECEDKVKSVINGLDKNAPILAWDTIQGLRSANGDKSNKTLSRFNAPPAELTTSIAAIAKSISQPLVQLERGTVIILHNPHFSFHEPSTIQAIQNMRELIEGFGANVVMLVPYGTAIPTVLSGDIMVVDDNPPDKKEIVNEIKEIVSCANYSLDDDEKISLSHDESESLSEILSGFSLFANRQMLTVSMQEPTEEDPNIFNKMVLQQQKVKQIENVPGLTIWNGNEMFTDLAGLDQLVWFCKRLTKHTRIVVLLDEIEKQLGNTGSALDGGTSMAQFGQVLSFMEDKKTDGILLAGSPGTGKSHVAKSVANEAKCLCLAVNWTQARGRFVGETEGNTARILKTIETLAGNGILFVATSNDITRLPPELIARFTLGTFMVELAEGKALDNIWKLRLNEFGVKTKPTFNYRGYSGRDIRNACRLASKLGIHINEVENLIVPTAQQNPLAVSMLREQADGRYLDASKPGVYRNREKQPVAQKKTGRKVDLKGSWTTSEVGVS